MKWLKNIEDHISYIFSTKEKKVEQTSVNINSEIPKVIFDHFSNDLSVLLEKIGFRYIKSSKEYEYKTDSDLYARIRLHSNRDNKVNVLTELSVHFYISSNNLKFYSKKNPFFGVVVDRIINHDFGILIDVNKGAVVWNLVYKEQYQNALDVIFETCKNRLISIYIKMCNKEFVYSEIKNNNLTLCDPITTILFLKNNNQNQIIEQYLEGFVSKKHEQIYQKYIDSKKDLDTNGLPGIFYAGQGYGYEIALLEKYYNLQLNIINK